MELHPENLISLKDRTPEERKRIGAMGGRQKGINNQRRKLLKEEAEAFLSMPLKSEKIRNDLINLGFKEEDINNQTPIMVALWTQIVKGGKNSVQAYNSLMATLGENIQKVEISKGVGETIDEIDNYLKGDK